MLPSVTRSAVEGAPEKWITSVLVTDRPSTSVGTPTGISNTVERKAPLRLRRRGEEHLERGVDALARAGRPGDGERALAPRQILRVEQEERHAAEMIAVQMAQDDRVDRVRIDVAHAQRHMRRGAAIDQERSARSAAR